MTTTVEVTPFAPVHMAAATELLARRHGRHRSAEPLLAKQFSSRTWPRLGF